MNDRGLWVSWYNLPAAGADYYLAWLHNTYIPGILKKPGVLWASHYRSEKVAPAPRIRHTDDPAVPTGADYVLIFGGETAHAFSKGTGYFLTQSPEKLHPDLTAADRKMLAMRTAERVCIMTEVARRDGPEINRVDGRPGLSPCIQIGSFIASTLAAEEELLTWYSDWRFAALGNLPGCVAIRQYATVYGWAKHSVIYEFLSRQDRDAHFPHLRKLYPVEGAWSDKTTPTLAHTPESPVVGARIWPPIK